MSRARSAFAVPFAFLTLCLALSAVARAGDVAGSKDSPLLKRYEGSTIAAYSTADYDAYTLPVGPATGAYNTAALAKSKPLEGRLTRLTYLVPSGRSALEVVRNYEGELRSRGYHVLYQGAGVALSGRTDRMAFVKAAGYGRLKLNSVASVENVASLGEKDPVYLAAMLERPEGDVHVAILGVEISANAIASLGLQRVASPGQVLVQVDLVEAKPMETRMVTVSASEMSEAIASRGSIALYGIYFDTNSAEVKAESAPALAEIAKLLATDPKLRLLVVGHTDSVGTYEANLDLSARRARAVVQALATRHGADARRLVPVGVSFASPVASNRSEDGRAKNRRVQLVEH